MFSNWSLVTLHITVKRNIAPIHIQILSYLFIFLTLVRTNTINTKRQVSVPANINYRLFMFEIIVKDVVEIYYSYTL